MNFQNFSCTSPGFGGPSSFFGKSPIHSFRSFSTSAAILSFMQPISEHNTMEFKEVER